MSARTRRTTAAAVALTAAITTGGALLLTGCGPTDSTDTGAAPAGSAPASANRASATPSGATRASASPTATKPAVNGTANSKLTISNGTNHVLMNGTSVDFGTIVRDLAWSPNGSKAVFINGSGDLVVSNPDGSGRVVVAKNPGGQTWSHPTWQVMAADENVPTTKNNIFFAVAQGGTSRLAGVSATDVNGTPQTLRLGTEAGDNVPELPQTGNTWPNSRGSHGTAVYANTTTGDVYIRDDYLRQQGSVITQGSQPALAPNAQEIVFVRSVGGHDHIFEENLLEGRTAKDLTPNATTDYTEPAWSPDGTTLAVRTPDGIATLPADGSAAPTMVSTYPGLPAYRG
ncbi:hypothetical protein GCM10010193_15810 [Kitasatospora atroaurantiaca]|uniref:WD40 repeat protein n=1 Tax=Kitasatospora atroaurantiaca TaxID=285545 RepID=A0A561EIM1_9ACTN|nr:PD40 domain-containing protein [Kitasatospora atroaurantiaca]TWE15466.1 WD40 repeat protein [Kitasatospora atroaurantiaca]